jgi:predicted nucleotidyltransferase
MRHPIIDRCVAACQADPRVVAAVLSGSYARGTADSHSDIDLAVITTDRVFGEFLGRRTEFLHLLGDQC